MVAEVNVCLFVFLIDFPFYLSLVSDFGVFATFTVVHLAHLAFSISIAHLNEFLLSFLSPRGTLLNDFVP